MKLVSVEEMKAIETAANEHGLTYAQMMENAGKGLANIIENSYSQLEGQVVLGLVGTGNNGGDTLIALTALAASGWEAIACLVKPRPDGDDALSGFIAAGGEVFEAKDDTQFKQLKKAIQSSNLVLDGILGTGIKLPLKPDLGRILGAAQESINTMDDPPLVVAVDCPSGVDCDSGQAAPETIPADLTVCMAAVKRGMLLFPAFGLIGELRVVDIGLPNDLPGWKDIKREVADIETARQLYPERKLDSHKGTYGTALLVVGSVNYTGAALLTAQAAYRSGTGLVTLAVPSPLHQALAGAIPEATWLLLPNEQGVIAESAANVVVDHLKKVDAILLGPGWGTEETTQAFLNRLLDINIFHEEHPMGFVPAAQKSKAKPETLLPAMVVDADGLKILSKIKNWPDRLPEQTVLTPHPGEMAVLTGLDIQEIQKDRIMIAEKYAKEWGKVVVLKGAGTVVSSPDGRSTLIPIATSALAKAGTGDVLAGIITGLLAQGLQAYPAAVCGAWLHAHAGLFALEALGNPASVLAGDIALAIPDVLNELGVADSR